VPPSSSYDVEVYDSAASSWKPVHSTLLCYDYLENDAEHSSYKDCNLHVKSKSRSHHMTYMKLKANFSAEEETASEA